MGDVTGSAPEPARGAVAAIRCGQAVREIITAWVVHRDTEHAASLVSEYLETHGRGLLDAASTFIAHHLTDAATPELAEDRFYYLLTRIGNVIDLAAEVTDTDPGGVVLEAIGLLAQLESSAADESWKQAYRATQTCLVAHRLVRLGRSPWGIQRSLDQTDMLVINSALAEVLVLIAGSFPEEARAVVFVELLSEARHILSCQAKAHRMTLECLIERYFTALAANESCLSV